MKKLFFAIIPLLVFLLSLSACGPPSPVPGDAAPSPPTTANMAPYENSLTPTGMLRPEGMPPPEGLSEIEGRMLLPVSSQAGGSFYYGQTKYGFISEKGESVTDRKYITFYYCGVDGKQYFSRGEQRKYKYLVASTGEVSDIFTMDGKKVLEIPGENAEIIKGEKYIIATYTVPDFYTDPNTGEKYDSRRYCATIYDMRSGERLLNNEYTSVWFINDYTVFLSAGYNGPQYFCDITKDGDSRILLQGMTNVYEIEDRNDFLIPAYTYDNYGDQIYGYLGPDGKWAIKPAYSEALTFAGDYAAVKIRDDSWLYINRRGNVMGALDYDYIYTSYDEDKTIAYEATKYAYYNSDGINMSDSLFIYLDENFNEIKSKLLSEEKYRLSDKGYYDEGKSYGIPANYDNIIFGSEKYVVFNNENADLSSFFLNLETGESKLLGNAYIYWYPVNKDETIFIGIRYNDTKKFDVFDVNGDIMTDTLYHRFPSLVLDLWGCSSTYFDISDKYFWVTTARYQGYITLDGEWVYRESRYQSLID
ncbi:MAG: WG repeat-containing protein [Oscillospiraceae bacterium]|nr:WG repeat-containing protein [Oscillospiraceae bacterium]